MYEREKELTDALGVSNDPDVEKIRKLLAEPLDFAYVLGRLIYSDVHKQAWKMICDHQLNGLLNREFRNALKALSE